MITPISIIATIASIINADDTTTTFICTTRTFVLLLLRIYLCNKLRQVGAGYRQITADSELLLRSEVANGCRGFLLPPPWRSPGQENCPPCLEG